MSYILCLGFNLSLYKKIPTIRISINEQFIDEFELEAKSQPLSDIKKDDNSKFNLFSHDYFKNIKAYHSLDSIEDNKKEQFKNLNFFNDNVFFKFYELSEEICNLVSNKSIIIEILNSDSNYNNGFMTRSTLVSVLFAYILPKEILSNFNNFLDQYYIDRKKFRSLNSKEEQVVNYYAIEDRLFDLLEYNDRRCNGVFWVSNTNYKTRIGGSLMGGTLVGGNGFYELFFNKELISYNKNKHNFRLINLDLLRGLSYKYKQYENQ